MGIKGFTNVFPSKEIVTLKSLNGSVIAIDAMQMLYSASLGANINTLTDKNGNPTLYINVIYTRIVNLHSAGIKQIWVLDYKSDGAYHIPSKEQEIKKRKEKKKKDLKKITALEEKKLLFSSSEDEEKAEECSKEHCEKEIQKYKKRTFRVGDREINTLIDILNWFCIKWIISPKGYEAEQICAITTYDNRILGYKTDYVLSSDADCMAFGAAKMLKFKDKKYKEYKLNDILADKDISLDDLIKICVILGCDFAGKTPRIGEKTVLKKFRDVQLTDEQLGAVEQFKKSITPEEIDALCVYNKDIEPFSNYDKFKEFLEWITEEKGFNKTRVLNVFKKAKLYGSL
jgi:XPG I-region/XPG N-terminal domain